MFVRQICLRFACIVYRKLQGGRVFGLLAAAAVLLPASLDGAARAQSAGARPFIWLGGMDPSNRSRRFPDKVPSDLYAMFSPGAPWQRLASGLQAFKLAPNTVLSGSREDLLRVFADLRQRHIALAMEAGWLVGQGPGRCGSGIEGFAAPNTAGAMARRIQRLGGDLAYVAMDEPLYWGHAFAGARSCQFSMEETAREVAAGVAQIRAVFPRVQIGDTEPIGSGVPGWAQEIGQWMQAYRSATGTPLAFMHADIQWRENWQAVLPQVKRVVHAQGVPFGVIMDGNGDSDEEWTGTALQRYRMLQSNPATHADQIVVQSWEEHPSQMMPETRPGTSSNLALTILQSEQRSR